MGKCRNSLYKSFGDEPDDQEGFSFEAGDSTTSNSTFRFVEITSFVECAVELKLKY